MAGPSKQPFRGKQRLDSKRLPRRPKSKKPHSYAQDGEKRSNIRPGGLWGIIGLVGSFAALWLYSSGQQGKQRRRKADADSKVLAVLRSRPLVVSGHGACRMDCRWELLSTFRMAPVLQLCDACASCGRNCVSFSTYTLRPWISKLWQPRRPLRQYVGLIRTVIQIHRGSRNAFGRWLPHKR